MFVKGAPVECLVSACNSTQHCHFIALGNIALIAHCNLNPQPLQENSSQTLVYRTYHNTRGIDCTMVQSPDSEFNQVYCLSLAREVIMRLRIYPNEVACLLNQRAAVRVSESANVGKTCRSVRTATGIDLWIYRAAYLSIL